jgi:hypothetical protein
LTGTISGTIQVQNDCRVQIQTLANSYSVFVPVDYTFDTATAVLTGSEGWRLMSSPVQSNYSTFLSPVWTQGATAASSTAGTPNVYHWNKNVSGRDVNDWLPVTDLNTSIPQGEGFLMYVYNQDDFGSTPSTGFPKLLPARGTPHTPDISPVMNTNTDGWTLLGNPFATTIDWSRVTKSNVHNSVYVWDANDATGVQEDPDQGNAGSWKVNASGVGEFDGMIRPFQGFFVQNSGASPSVTFTEDSKKPGGEYFGKDQENPFTIRLNMEGESMQNSTWLRFSNQGSFDRIPTDGLQLVPLSDHYTTLSSVKEDGRLLDVGHFPFPEGSLEIPLAVETTRPGSYTISVTDMNLPDGLRLGFKDLVTGEIYSLHDTFTHPFDIQHAAKVPADPFEIIDRGPIAAKQKGEPRFAIVKLEETSTRELPNRVTLFQNFPNPFNPATTIRYALPEAANVKLEVFDLTGRRVALLVNERAEAGTHTVSFDASNLSSGLYLYRLTAGNSVLNRSLTLIK